MNPKKDNYEILEQQNLWSIDYVLERTTLHDLSC